MKVEQNLSYREASDDGGIYLDSYNLLTGSNQPNSQTINRKQRNLPAGPASGGL